MFSDGDDTESIGICDGFEGWVGLYSLSLHSISLISFSPVLTFHLSHRNLSSSKRQRSMV